MGMTIQSSRFTCAECEHVFDEDIAINCPIEVFNACLKAIRCPACGSNRINSGGAHKDPPGLSAPLDERLDWWLKRGDVGTSSDTIRCVMTGSLRREVDMPHDPSDFNRCRELLALIPEWRPRLSEVSAKYPWYEPFIRRWDELDRMFEMIVARKYKGSKQAIKAWEPFYTEMRLAHQESQRIRYPKRESGGTT